MAVGTHWYFSTACQHQKHEECDQTCKFCEARCTCRCHQEVEK